MNSVDLYNEKLIAGNRFEIKKVILNSDDLGIYICTDTESSDNKLYTVNVYKSEKYISKASAICKDLSSDEHNDFYGMFRHEFGLFVVFNYYNGIEIRKYISNNNPEIIERLILGDEVIKRAVEINSYPILIRVTAMQLKNVVVMNDNTIGANYFLDFDNIIELITDTKYISSAGNVLYEVFADSKNCPNQIDAFIVKAAFGRYDSLDKLALEYSAIKSEILDFFEGDDQSDSNILKKDTPKQKKTFLHRDKSHIDPVSPAIDKTDSPNDTKNIYVKNEKIVQEPVHDKVIKKSFIHDMLEKKMSEQKEEKTPEKVQEI